MMCFGILLSAVSDRPNGFGNNSASPRMCGTPDASGSGLSIAFRMQELGRDLGPGTGAGAAAGAGVKDQADALPLEEEG